MPSPHISNKVCDLKEQPTINNPQSCRQIHHSRAAEFTVSNHHIIKAVGAKFSLSIRQVGVTGDRGVSLDRKIIQ